MTHGETRGSIIYLNVLKPADTKPRGNYDTDSSTYDEALNRPISLEEVQSAITQLQEDKAPGPYSICPSVIKDDRMCQYFHRLFQICFENGVVPQAWLDSTIQPIYEGKGNKHDPNNYRGITLQSCIAKAFAKIINIRLGDYLERKNLLHDEQNGLRKNRCCQDQISTLYFIIENRKLSKEDTFACFVDFKKAFDSVPRDILWKKLSKIGVNNKILNSIKALYKNIQCSVRINNDLTPPFPMTNGVKQGCPLSPTLFNIFINDLIDYLDCYASEGLNFGKCKLYALLYADDLVLIAENPETLDKLLKTLTRWCLDNGMSINHNKTTSISS